MAYQPVSYRIESRKGTRAQFQSMVEHLPRRRRQGDRRRGRSTTCPARTTAAPAGPARPTAHYDYPGIYQTQDFHHCGRNGGDDIVNYNDRYEVQNCELVNLADLKTESDYVRTRIAGYLNDLLSLGVDGFRLDASKHMPAADIAAIKGKLTRSAYIVQEVIYGAGEPIQPTEYTGNGDVHEFRYGKDLARVFRNERLAYLNNFGEAWGYLPSSSAAVFVDNHDTQRDGGDVLTYRDSGIYALANAFMLAWPYGSPTVMSSYTFTNRDQGPPSDANGKTSNTHLLLGGWRCEHRWQVIANMVGFRNADRGAGGRQLVRQRQQAHRLRPQRQGLPHRSTTRTSRSTAGRTTTNLPAGRYCDVIHGDVHATAPAAGRCITVDSAGWFARQHRRPRRGRHPHRRPAELTNQTTRVPVPVLL